ncbi:MAG TPA: N-formylglutamate deformylase [Rhizomicrobium sp.]|jgi:formiminoglutamase|nr:N-formylglutamate deformylase [Rhizomicrobium sp.]
MNAHWLSVTRGNAPLIVSMPHTGTDIPPELEWRFVSSWLARKDADWWVDLLYDFAPALDATIVRTSLSRSVIDVNRDPSGRSLYPGQNTTELCPTTSFDGEPLYHEGETPDAEEIAQRRDLYFMPYHAALEAEIARLRDRHPRTVLFEAHSIRSRIPRLFDGELPNFNIGTNSGTSCGAELTSAIEQICDAYSLPPKGGERAHSFTCVTNGRFKGGWTTRHYGNPAHGVHAVQLELAIRGYMDEPDVPTPENWPQPYDAERAAPMRAILHRILETCLGFASES